jgi:hypothetical protein
MASESEFLKVQQQVDQASRARQAHPSGWEPKLIVEGDRAELISRPIEGDGPPPGWEEEFRSRGGDPSLWKPAGPVRFSSWDAQRKGGEIIQMFAYRWSLIPIRQEEEDDLDDLIRKIKRHRKKAPEQKGQAPRGLVIALSDWQVGKGEGGGHEALIERVIRLRDLVPQRIRELKKIGAPIDRIFVIGLGDLVEGCSGHYPAQEASISLDRRQQARVVRRLLVELLTSWAPLAPQIVLGGVPGNHGENRKDGKMFTSFEDNDDLGTIEQASEILAANPEAYGHIRTILPEGDMTLTLDVAGTVVSFAHGHQARKGSIPQQKVMNWWEDKAMSRHPVGDADLLITGHFHFFTAIQDGPRTALQCPALDGGSRWFEEQGGSTTLAGTLTFVCDEAGWDHLRILR